MTSTNDLVGTDRLEMLFDQGKVVVDKSSTVTITRLKQPERELSEQMSMQDVARLFRGELDSSEVYTTEERSEERRVGKEWRAGWGRGEESERRGRRRR